VEALVAPEDRVRARAELAGVARGVALDPEAVLAALLDRLGGA
jgi:hypothetical protein